MKIILRILEGFVWLILGYIACVVLTFGLFDIASLWIPKFTGFIFDRGLIIDHVPVIISGIVLAFFSYRDYKRGTLSKIVWKVLLLISHILTLELLLNNIVL